MFEYCRSKNVVPNTTINGNGLNKKMAENLVKYCGAVAVSHYNNDVCFNAVNLLSKTGLKQVNIHKLMAKETLDSCYELLDLVKIDSHLKKLNAIVFLTLKNKGERNIFHKLLRSEFMDLVNYALQTKIRIGFDSCAANDVLKLLKTHPRYEMLKMMSEPCESTCFSLYINVDGIAYPCSFLEEIPGYESIDVVKSENFFKDIWFNPIIKDFRKKLIKNLRNCPQFKIVSDKGE